MAAPAAGRARTGRLCRGTPGRVRAESGGHVAFWQAIEWVYAHTRSDGLGLPEGLRYPGLNPAVEQCLASERPETLIRAQAEEATKGGVTATPSLRLHDRQTSQAILLQGPIEGDALLSAMDMLAAEDSVVSPTTEMPADVVATCPGSPRSLRLRRSTLR